MYQSYTRFILTDWNSLALSQPGCYGCRVDRVEYVKCLSWHLVGHQNTMILTRPQPVNTGHPAASTQNKTKYFRLRQFDEKELRRELRELRRLQLEDLNNYEYWVKNLTISQKHAHGQTSWAPVRVKKENKNMLVSRLFYVSHRICCKLCVRWLGLTETTSVLSRDLSVIFTAGNCNIGPGRGNMSD